MNQVAQALDSWVERASSSYVIVNLSRWIQNTLLAWGYADDTNDNDFPSPRSLVYTILVVYATMILSLLAMRSRASRQDDDLKRELYEAREQLQYLQSKLDSLENTNGGVDQNQKEKKQVRIFMDGVFDLMHYGHMNAFRLARALGTHLVVGIDSDETIIKCKGTPLMNDEERIAMVSQCKFVDTVVPGIPYVMNREFLNNLIEKYDIDYVVHGDDPCIVDGKDVYATAKESGKYRSIPRTEGVSTTDIVGRMLVMSKEHHLTSTTKKNDSSSSSSSSSSPSLRDSTEYLSRQSTFLTTSRMLKLFSADAKAPAPGMKIAYIDGAWDMFHPGHVALLQAAKKRCDFLIVGVHGDDVVNRVLGSNLPLLNLHERVLSVLGCRFVDDVLIDPPYEITEEMLASLNISEVLESPDTGYGDALTVSGKADDRFRLIRKNVRFQLGRNPSNFSLQNVFQRIHKNQDMFEARFERKMDAERKFYEQKHSSGGMENENAAT